jgi:acyl-coenzyme A synthetase/AMP-(fatty) acid ligase
VVGLEDDAMNIARQGIGTIEVESGCLKHRVVFEAGAWLKVKEALMDKKQGKHLFSMPLG